MQIIRTSSVPPPPRQLVTSGGKDSPSIFKEEFDLTIERPSDVVIDTVAFIHNVDPVELDPLAEVIDPEALGALLTASQTPDTNSIRVTFGYENLTITITSAGRLRLWWADQK